MDSPMNLLVGILQSSLLVPLTLLPIINPVGNAPIFMSITRGSEALSRQMSRQVAVNAWVILMLSMLVGRLRVGRVARGGSKDTKITENP